MSTNENKNESAKLEAILKRASVADHRANYDLEDAEITLRHIESKFVEMAEQIKRVREAKNEAPCNMVRADNLRCMATEISSMLTGLIYTATLMATKAARANATYELNAALVNA